MSESEGTPATSGKARSRSRSQRTRRREKTSDSATQGELLPDGKLYYRIGEVAKITAVKPHVLRYWETEFRGMVPPKSRSKQRLYRRKDIEMVLAIKRLLYDERYTIAGARQQLRELGLAKALEPLIEQQTETAAIDVPMSSSSSSSDAAVAELRSGYRRIRRQLEIIRDSI